MSSAAHFALLNSYAANCSAPAGKARKNCGATPFRNVCGLRLRLTPLAWTRVRTTSIGCRHVCAMPRAPAPAMRRSWKSSCVVGCALAAVSTALRRAAPAARSRHANISLCSEIALV